MKQNKMFLHTMELVLSKNILNVIISRILLEILIGKVEVLFNEVKKKLNKISME